MTDTDLPKPFEPPKPTLTAALVSSIWLAILSIPMWAGKFVADPYSDQYSTGYAFREWAATQWKTLGHFPLWNPEMYVGLPFVAGMHGDLFYPTAFLRLVLPTDIGMNIGFAVHYVLAAVFMYLFLRAIKVSWTGSVVGALAYQLSGVIGSYVSPGHDGKLFVSALLPLALLALTRAIRDRKWEGYGIFALVVGLALLSPHPQMVQYFLLAAGIYAVYLVSALPAGTTIGKRALPLGIALAGVFLGLGIAALQYFPFYAYIPFSPRDQTVLADFAFSTSYGVPWDHVTEFFVSRFSGETFLGTYWGSNGIKLHSEYLGLPVVALAISGFRDKARRTHAWWLLGIGVLFLLVSMGGATPFYKIWWNVVPFVKSTRAPGMALFCVSFVVATFASFGVDRVLQGKSSLGKPALIVGAAVALLGLTGVFGTVAGNLAASVEASTGRVGLTAFAMRAGDSIRMGALASGVALGILGFLVMQRKTLKLSTANLGMLLIAVVGTDLWLNARPFWRYTDVRAELFSDDPVKDYLNDLPKPLRVMNESGIYPGGALMADGIAQWYGHHGNELHAFDVTNGRIPNSLNFTQSTNGALAALYGINHIIVPTAAISGEVPGFHRAIDSAMASVGVPTTILERTEPMPYARVIRVAVKATLEQAAATVTSPQFPLDHVVILDESSPLDPGPAPDSLPDPWELTAEVEDWVPGAMRVVLSEPLPEAAYLLVAENHYKDWIATVDGEPAITIRGNGSLITVPLPAGAREVSLTFESPEFSLGVKITWISLILTLAAVTIPPIRRRRDRA